MSRLQGRLTHRSDAAATAERRTPEVSCTTTLESHCRRQASFVPAHLGSSLSCGSLFRILPRNFSSLRSVLPGEWLRLLTSRRRPEMVFRDLIRDVFQTLWAHKLRTALTMFGIAWGVISIVLMVAAGEGLRVGTGQGLAQLRQRRDDRLRRTHQPAGRWRARRTPH